MLKRDITSELKEMAASYPIVTLTGPRQSGKTTLVRNIFKGKPYISLEDPYRRAFILDDPRGFFAHHQSGAILDEIQNAPILLSYIQGIVDETKEHGLFILTGSHQLALHQAITQSLAGRTGLLNLLPLSLLELKSAKLEFSLDDYLYHGFYPRIYDQKLNPTKTYRGYIQTYIERDVRQLIQIRDLSLFQQFLKLLAGRIGQIFNATALCNDLGVSHHTVREWLSVLEASFIIFRLQPYFENFGKRMIKSPKIYFTDVGLASYLLGIENKGQLYRDPIRGHLVENLVILDLIKYRFNKGLDHQLYYYRDSNQNEIDLIYKYGHELIPIEIKAGQTYHSEFLNGLKYFQKLVGRRCKKGFLIYSGEDEQKIQAFHVLNYQHATKIFSLLD